MESSGPPFRQQVVVVTGATGAIGNAIASRLRAGGATLCLVGRTPENLASLEESFKGSDTGVHLFRVDLTSDQQVEEFGVDIKRRFGSLHTLVHSAGTIAMERIHAAKIQDLDHQYRVNLRAPYVLTQSLLPLLIQSRGQIVFVNSSAGLNARKGAGQYAATKHALRGFADSLREEVNEEGVRVLSVYLGRTASRMQAAVYEREGRPYDPTVLLQTDDVASVVVHALTLPRTAEVTDISMRPFKKSY